MHKDETRAPPAGQPPLVDFLGGAVGHRHRSGAGRGHALVRAVGLKPGQPLAIVDATAGLGRDAFLLASLGADVTLVERVSSVRALLAAAIARLAGAGPAHAAIAARMRLVAGDARDLLPELPADVVTVDPMHPARLGSALVKAEMRRLRALVGDDPDSATLVAAGLASRAPRVVLKWPLRAPPPPGLPAPSHSLPGRTVRYDVFVRASRDAAGRDAAGPSGVTPGRGGALRVRAGLRAQDADDADGPEQRACEPDDELTDVHGSPLIRDDVAKL